VKDLHDWISVKRLFKQGVEIKQIATQMKMSRNTVKRLLNRPEAPVYKRRVKTKVDPHY